MPGRPRPIEGELWSIPLDLLKPNPANRDLGPEEDLLELGRSIAQHSLLQPLVVERVPGGFRLIAGHRRAAAARLMGMPALAARVREASSPSRRAAAAAVENLQRRQLSPMEEARACNALLVQMGVGSGGGIAGVARQLGRSQPWVRDRLALLDLPADAQALVDQRQLTLGEGADLGRQAAAQLAAARTPGNALPTREAPAPAAPVPSRLTTALEHPALRPGPADPAPDHADEPPPPAPAPAPRPAPPARARPAAVVHGAKPPTCPPHFTGSHRLAATARVHCDRSGHPKRGRVGDLACGACWELAIRLDTPTDPRSQA